MKKLLIISLVAMLTIPVSAGENYFLKGFTSTGYSSYDWRFEPLKTDKERANLKGNVSKVITTIIDKVEFAGYNSSDTTYYDTAGNILRIVSPKVSIDGKMMNPTWYNYVYKKNGLLERYEQYEDTESRDGHYMQAHVHTIHRDDKDHPTKEEYRAYAAEKGKWVEFSSGDCIAWTFGYDANGNLVGGKGPLNMKLTYKNGQLTRMKADDFEKPVTYTYDAQGRMTGMKFFFIDGMDEAEYTETSVKMTYNEKGYLSGAVKETWENNSKWIRRKIWNKTTYTITYTYDEQGNWTKAVMYAKTGQSPRTMAVTINRVITYR